MKKVRKDRMGRVLHRGESFKNTQQLYCYAYTDPLGKRRCIYAKDLPELREKEKQVQFDRLDGLDVYAKSRCDINYVFDRYISTKTELRSTTKTNYLCIYDRYVREGFGRKRISDVVYSDVLMFYKALLDRGLKVNTIDSVHCVLHPTFQMAVRDNILRNNPTDGVMAEIKKKEKGRPEPRHALTLEQERAFLKWIEKPEYVRWKPLFTVMFGTGCRVGEIIGLRWCDVDFKKNEISINHNVTYYPRSDKSFKCEYKVDLPKTASGIRVIPMLDVVREALIEERDYQKKYDCRCTVELDGMTGFIFSNRFGQLLNHSNINREIKRMVNDHNAREEVLAAREKREPFLIPYFSCHITRHTFCSRLCENETNVKVIQYVMGHKDIQTTLDIYAETSDRKNQEVFKNLNGLNVV